MGHEQVKRGLFGAFVVTEPVFADGIDQVVAVHTLDGRRTINGTAGAVPLDARPGQPVRARLINTDAGPLRAWVSGAPYRVVAVDGRPVHQPTDIVDESVLVTAGGRIDLALVTPHSGNVRIDVGAGAALGSGNADSEPTATVDFLTYGAKAGLGFDPGRANRTFAYPTWPTRT